MGFSESGEFREQRSQSENTRKIDVLRTHLREQINALPSVGNFFKRALLFLALASSVVAQNDTFNPNINFYDLHNLTVDFANRSSVEPLFCQMENLAPMHLEPEVTTSDWNPKRRNRIKSRSHRERSSHSADHEKLPVKARNSDVELPSDQADAQLFRLAHDLKELHKENYQDIVKKLADLKRLPDLKKGEMRVGLVDIYDSADLARAFPDKRAILFDSNLNDWSGHHTNYVFIREMMRYILGTPDREEDRLWNDAIATWVARRKLGSGLSTDFLSKDLNATSRCDENATFLGGLLYASLHNEGEMEQFVEEIHRGCDPKEAFEQFMEKRYDSFKNKKFAQICEDYIKLVLAERSGGQGDTPSNRNDGNSHGNSNESDIGSKIRQYISSWSPGELFAYGLLSGTLAGPFGIAVGLRLAKAFCSSSEDCKSLWLYMFSSVWSGMAAITLFEKAADYFEQYPTNPGGFIASGTAGGLGASFIGPLEYYAWAKRRQIGNAAVAVLNSGQEALNNSWQRFYRRVIAPLQFMIQFMRYEKQIRRENNNSTSNV